MTTESQHHHSSYYSGMIFPLTQYTHTRAKDTYEKTMGHSAASRYNHFASVGSCLTSFIVFSGQLQFCTRAWVTLKACCRTEGSWTQDQQWRRQRSASWGRRPDLRQSPALPISKPRNDTPPDGQHVHHLLGLQFPAASKALRYPQHPSCRQRWRWAYRHQDHWLSPCSHGDWAPSSARRSESATSTSTELAGLEDSKTGKSASFSRSLGRHQCLQAQAEYAWSSTPN